MTQFETSSSYAGSRRRKIRKPLHVDMTPMVDLAFLLITFFMLVSTLHKNTAIDLHMPEIDGERAAITADRTLTLIADGNNRLLYYNGIDIAGIKQTRYGKEGIRSLLIANEKRIASSTSPEKGLICILKATDKAKYENLVDLLDEMVVTGVTTYAIQDIMPEEQEEISKNILWK